MTHNNPLIWIAEKIGSLFAKETHDPRGMADQAAKEKGYRNVFSLAHERAVSGEGYLYNANSAEDLARVDEQINRSSALGRIEWLKRERLRVMREIEAAVKAKRAREHLRQRLAKLTAEQLSLERLWECG